MISIPVLSSPATNYLNNINKINNYPPPPPSLPPYLFKLYKPPLPSPLQRILDSNSNQEICWQNSTLVLSENCQIYRILSFNNDNLTVAHASFGKTFIKSDDDHPTKCLMVFLHSNSSSNNTGNDIDLAISSTANLARLFFPDPGLDYSLPLPFNISKAWNLDIGWLIERSDARRAGERVSSWAILSGIWEPWRPLGGCKGYDVYTNPIRPFDFTPRPKSKIVLVTQSECTNKCTINNWPLLLTFDTQTKTLSLYRYIRLKNPIKTSPPSPEYNNITSLPHPPFVSSNLRRVSTPRPTASRRRSSIKSKNIDNTFDNSDISLTMDRMILAGESASNRIPPGSKPDDSETLSNESDVLIDLLWELKAPDNDHSIPTAHTFNQTDSQLSLAIHFSGLSSQLAIINLSRDVTRAVTSHITIKEIEIGISTALSISSIKCTSEIVEDLIIIDQKRDLKLLTNNSRNLINIDNPCKNDNDQPRSFKDSHGSCITIETTSSKVFRYDLQKWPKDNLTKICFDVINATLHEIQRDTFRLKMFKFFDANNGDMKALIKTLKDFATPDASNLMTQDDENILNKVVKTKAHDRAMKSTRIFAMNPHLLLDNVKKNEFNQFNTDKSPYMAAQKVLLALHLVAEDCLLDISTRVNNLITLGPLLGWLSHLCGRKDYAGWWERWAGKYNEIEGCHIDFSNIISAEIPSPPCLFNDIFNRLKCVDSTYPDIPDNLLHSTKAIQKVFILIGQMKFEDAVDELIANKFDNERIRNLPLNISVIIQELLRACQLNPKLKWSTDAYKLIGREDLVANANVNNESNVQLNRGLDEDRDKVTIQNILDLFNDKKDERGVNNNDENKNDDNKVISNGIDFEDNEIPRLRFSQDHRLREVGRLLNSSELTKIRMLNHTGLPEPDFLKEQENAANAMPERTCSLPFGRAMFTYGTAKVVPPGPLIIPDFDFRVKVVPTGTTYDADFNNYSPEFKDWAEFSNGVAAALKLGPNIEGVDESWIMLNKPTKNIMSPRQSGLMLGLGLNGHLKSMWLGHIQKFLEPKNEFMTIATMLGVASSYVGEPPERIVGAFSLHVPAILPSHPLEFNLSGLTQAAGLFSLGVLHLGTRQRRQAEILLNEIGGVDVPTNDGKSNVRGSYSLSAALGFGLIMLGKGKEASSLSETQMITKLKQFMYGDKNIDNDASDKGNEYDAVDINFTSPGATLALGLWFLKSERYDVASLMNLPNNLTELDWIRPDFLLFRVIAKNLIMFNDIGRDRTWVESQLPFFIKDALKRKRENFEQIDDSIELAYYNIVAGACLLLGLKFAGTADEDTYACLLYYMDTFTQASSIKSITYEGKVKRSSIRSGLNTITIAMAAIMAGTGEIGILKRLRIAHGQFDKQSGKNFGSQISTHMAIGMLFLGGGEYTLTNSNEAIGFMLCSFYPKWPIHGDDQSCHPLSYRHLWVKAVEKRCLIPRDVKTNETVYVPIKLKVLDEFDKLPKSLRLISPTLVPKYSKLISLKVESPRYWPLTIDLNDKSSLFKLKNDQTFFVKKKAGYLSYSVDPKNLKSVASHSNSSVDLITVSKINENCKFDNVDSFNSSFEFSKSLYALSTLSKGENYINAILFDSLIGDKPVGVWYNLGIKRLLNNLLTIHNGNDTDNDSLMNSLELVLCSRELINLKDYYQLLKLKIDNPIVQNSLILNILRMMNGIRIDKNVLINVINGHLPEWHCNLWLSSLNFPDRSIILILFEKLDELNLSYRHEDEENVKVLIKLTLSQISSVSSSNEVVNNLYEAYKNRSYI